MITVTLMEGRVITVHQFEVFSDALVFARSQDIGTSFRITEGSTLLAKGIIEDYKEFRL
jgi:hypothetical protein